MGLHHGFMDACGQLIGGKLRKGAADASGATKKFHLSLCAKPTPAPEVKAKTGAAEANAEIVAKAETAVWQEWIDFNVTGPSGGCVPIYDERSKEKPDGCGNVLQAKCRCRITFNGSLGTLYFYFIPQGGEPIEVGKCCFLDAAHRFWYKEIRTADGSKRFVAAYHFNADLKRGADGAPVVPNRYVWRVRQLDFLRACFESHCCG
jgi:hypothetical protein